MWKYHCGALSLRSPPRRAELGWLFPCAAAVCVPCRRVCAVPPCVCRAAVGCTVPPWGVPWSRAEVERAPAQAALFSLVGLDRCFRCLPWSRAEVERAPAQVALFPLVGLDRCFRCLPWSRAEVERAPAQVALFPLVGLDGACKVYPAHQLHSGLSPPTSLQTQLANFTQDSAREKLLKSELGCSPPTQPQICSNSRSLVYLRTINNAPTPRRGRCLT